MSDPNFVVLCGARRGDGRVCIRPRDALDYTGLPHDQHRAADGKRWYYCDGERERAMAQSIPEYLDELEAVLRGAA